MLINSENIPGVRPGKDFKDSLLAPLEAKEYVYNESRLEDGIRVFNTPIKYKSRSLTLEFQITGSTKADMEARKQRLYDMFSMGTVDIEVPEFCSGVFHLIYTGKSPSYSSGLSGCACKIKVGFDEPNPTDRTANDS